MSKFQYNRVVIRPIRSVLGGLALASIASYASAQADIDLSVEDNRIGYSIGVNIGQNLVAQGIISDIDMDSFVVMRRAMRSS